MDPEHLWYELSPYVYGIGGLAALLYRPPQPLLVVSGVLLLGASVLVLRWRWRYRRALYREMPGVETLAVAAPSSQPQSDDGH